MNTELFDKVVQCDSIGFQIAKEYFNWKNLTIVEQHYKSSQVVYLANLIDSKFKAEYTQK